jgi:hypothetical protein
MSAVMSTIASQLEAGDCIWFDLERQTAIMTKGDSLLHPMTWPNGHHEFVYLAITSQERCFEIAALISALFNLLISTGEQIHGYLRYQFITPTH